MMKHSDVSGFRRLLKSIAVISLLAAAGCDVGAETAAPADSLESVHIALTSVPTSVQCIRISATPSSGTTIVKTFTVVSGTASTNLQVGPVLPGSSYTIAADAFTVACSSISGAGSWIATPVSVLVRVGVATSVTLTLHQNSVITTSANFAASPKTMAMTDQASYIVTDSGLQVANNASAGRVFVRQSMSAFDSSSIAGNALSTVVATYSGACGVRADGTLWCWGCNNYGELGTSIALNSCVFTPTRISALSNVKQIAAGYFHICAVGTAGGFTGLYCWGHNGWGQLGNCTTTNSSTPIYVQQDTVRSLAAGTYSTFAVTIEGTIDAWGFNNYGQLGDASTSDRPCGIISQDYPVQAVTAGVSHACALHFDGTVRCWGYNGDGELGDGTTTNRTAPTQISGLVAKQIVAGMYHTCALTTAGQTVCWGNNNYGQLGDGTGATRLSPTVVPLGGATLFSLFSGPGVYSTCGFSATSDVYCWGRNAYATLGDGTINNAFLPVMSQLQ